MKFQQYSVKTLRPERYQETRTGEVLRANTKLHITHLAGFIDYHLKHEKEWNSIMSVQG